MHVKKSLMVAGVTASMSIAGLGAAGTVSAMSGETSGQDNLITKIAEKFNLSTDEVKAVFDAHHSEKEAAMKQKTEERLSQAVTDGKITEDQKQKLLDKIDELEAERESERNNTQSTDDTDGATADADRRAAMKQKQTELKQWLGDNSIDESFGRYLMIGEHGGGVARHG